MRRGTWLRPKGPEQPPCGGAEEQPGWKGARPDRRGLRQGHDWELRGRRACWRGGAGGGRASPAEPESEAGFLSQCKGLSEC